MLNITRKAEADGTLTFALEGRLDTITSPDFEAELKNSLGGAKALVLDLKKLEYISSAGLRVLLTAQKTMSRKGGMTLKNVGETVMEILEVTGFTDILTIE